MKQAKSVTINRGRGIKKIFHLCGCDSPGHSTAQLEIFFKCNKWENSFVIVDEILSQGRYGYEYETV